MNDTHWIEILLIFMLYGGYLASIAGAYGDAQRRGVSGWLVVLIVLLTWPIGLIAWLVLRPEKRPATWS